MPYTIFIHEKPVILCSQTPESMRQRMTDKQLVILENPDLQHMAGLLQTLSEEAIQGYVWLSPDPDDLFEKLKQRYEYLRAAGGLVTNPTGEILLMFRRGKWDLPKGKMDPGETPEITALREVTEETGLQNIHIERKLLATWHAYHQLGKEILKQTDWYLMRFTGTELVIPQIEEDILDIQWIRPDNIAKYLPYSYPNLKMVFESVGYFV